MIYERCITEKGEDEIRVHFDDEGAVHLVEVYCSKFMTWLPVEWLRAPTFFVNRIVEFVDEQLLKFRDEFERSIW